MSSSVHQRSVESPEGDTANAKVRMSNLLVDNLVVLLRWAHCRGVHWLIEQPATSRMWSFPPMAALLRDTGARRVHTYMGCFGHRQPKPTVLWGTLPALDLLARSRSAVPEELRGQEDPRVVGYKKDSSGRVSGNKFLHESAAYTEGFGRAILNTWARASGSAGAAASSAAVAAAVGSGPVSAPHHVVEEPPQQPQPPRRQCRRRREQSAAARAGSGMCPE